MIRAYLQLKKTAHRAKPDAKFRARLHEAIQKASRVSAPDTRHTFLHPFRLAFAGTGVLGIILFSTGAYAYQSTSISPTHPLYDLRERLEDAESEYMAPVLGTEEAVEEKYLERQNHEIELINQELRSLDSPVTLL